MGDGTYAWIVEKSPRKIEVLSISLVKHGGGYVRYVSSRIALARNIDLEVLDSEYGLEVLEEFDKVFRRLLFGRCRRGPYAVASANGLVHPSM